MMNSFLLSHKIKRIQGVAWRWLDEIQSDQDKEYFLKSNFKHSFYQNPTIFGIEKRGDIRCNWHGETSCKIFLTWERWASKICGARKEEYYLLWTLDFLIWLQTNSHLVTPKLINEIQSNYVYKFFIKFKSN